MTRNLVTPPPDLGITAESKVYISESLTRYKKELFGEVNKLRKKIRWKHIWTQNSRIYVKEIRYVDRSGN